MPVDSERKTYGRRMTSSQMGWLSSRSMQAYSLWMAWLFQSDPQKQEAIRDLMTAEDSNLVAKAYRRK